MRTLFFLCLSCFFQGVLGSANEPIEPNDLGLMATDCASRYCTSKDSLLLWLALENTCFKEKQPYFPAADFQAEMMSPPMTSWTLHAASAVVGSSIVVGLVAGYAAGTARELKR